MEICFMEFTKIITLLNSRATVADIRLSTLDQFSLSSGEIELIKNYQPENHLVIYGTLAPGKPNHQKVAHIHGTWEKATISGKLENKGWAASQGFNGFRNTVEGEEPQTIEAFVLQSAMLPKYWSFLDEFEGTGYKRILSRYTLNNGEWGVGYIYAINEQQKWTV